MDETMGSDVWARATRQLRWGISTAMQEEGRRTIKSREVEWARH